MILDDQEMGHVRDLGMVRNSHAFHVLARQSGMQPHSIELLLLSFADDVRRLDDLHRSRPPSPPRRYGDPV
jgi:hypothetical protein